jgi:hypothetical protein
LEPTRLISADFDGSTRFGVNQFPASARRINPDRCAPPSLDVRETVSHWQIAGDVPMKEA